MPLFDPELFVALGACAGGYVVGSFLGLLLHEGAHALAASLVGLEPRAIVIGAGPTLLRRRYRRVWLIVHAWPIYGFAARLADSRGRRGAQAFVVAAGPAASLLLCVGAALGVTPALDADLLLFSEALTGVACSAGVQLLGSIWPRTFRAKGRAGLHATDGWKLMKLAWGKDVDDFQARYMRLLRTVLDEAEAAGPPSNLAPELVYQVTRPDKRESWALSNAAEVLAQLLDEPALSDAERLFIVRRYELDRRDAATA